jgi:hypothetical protein
MSNEGRLQTRKAWRAGATIAQHGMPAPTPTRVGSAIPRIGGALRVKRARLTCRHSSQREL